MESYKTFHLACARCSSGFSMVNATRINKLQKCLIFLNRSRVVFHFGTVNLKVFHFGTLLSVKFMV